LIGLEDMDLQATLIKRGHRIGWIEAGLLHHEESLGFRAYLSKKARRTPKAFADKNPEYWRELSSPLQRAKLVMRGVSRNRSLSSASLIPGLVLIRGAEYVVRWV
jgi:hypothetical protein